MIFALVAAFVLSLTFVPAMVALLVRGEVRDGESAIVRLAQSVYTAGARRPRFVGAVRSLPSLC